MSVMIPYEYKQLMDHHIKQCNGDWLVAIHAILADVACCRINYETIRDYVEQQLKKEN